MKSQNPMRISHESLNLDDIISDLNDTPSQTTGKQTATKPQTKSHATSSKTNLSKIGSKAKLTNKEN